MIFIFKYIFLLKIKAVVNITCIHLYMYITNLFHYICVTMQLFFAWSLFIEVALFAKLMHKNTTLKYNCTCKLVLIGINFFVIYSYMNNITGV